MELLASHHETLTGVVSWVAIGISLVALGWNIYRDIILKPRFRVRLRIPDSPPIWEPGQRTLPYWTLNANKVLAPYLELSVVNFGPGLLVVTSASAETLGLLSGEESVRDVNTSFDVLLSGLFLCSILFYD